MREVRGEALIACLLVLTFFGVIASGPAGVDYVKQKREILRHRRDRELPAARVMYLPSAACREEMVELLPLDPEMPTIDAVLRAVRERRRREWAVRHIQHCGCLYFCDITDGEEFQHLKKLYWKSESDPESE